MNAKDIKAIFKQYTDINKIELSDKNYITSHEFYNACINILPTSFINLFESCDDMTFENKQGKIIKRIARAAKKESIQWDSKIAGIIGGRIDKYKNKKSEFYFDLYKCSNGINWDDGQFGHSDSCWWGCYSQSKDVMESDKNTYCLRFYNSMDDDNGIGRTWIKVMDSGLIVGFNSYGISDKFVIRILQSITGLKFSKSIKLYNSWNSTIPYINGASGFAIAENEIKTGSINVDIESDSVVCQCCMENYSADTMQNYNGCDYCESCYAELFSYCEYCHKEVESDEIKEYTDESGLTFECCAECYQDNFIHCPHCKVVLCDDNNGDVCYNCQDDINTIGYYVLRQTRDDMIKAGQMELNI